MGTISLLARFPVDSDGEYEIHISCILLAKDHTLDTLLLKNQLYVTSRRPVYLSQRPFCLGVNFLRIKSYTQSSFAIS